MTLFIALTASAKNSTLPVFDFVCRAGVCGSSPCSSMAARSGCRTLTAELPAEIRRFLCLVSNSSPISR